MWLYESSQTFAFSIRSALTEFQTSPWLAVSPTAATGSVIERLEANLLEANLVQNIRSEAGRLRWVLFMSESATVVKETQFGLRYLFLHWNNVSPRSVLLGSSLPWELI